MVDTENQAAVANGAGNDDAAAVSLLEKKIIRQIEYYFGDYNLPKDKFLQGFVKENEGWLTIETLLKFKRLADLSKDSTVILAAMRKSKSGLMEVEGEGEKGRMRRSPAHPLPDNSEESKLDVQARTAYAKGFDKEKTTLDELLEYFLDHEPTVINIQMRSYVDKREKDKNRHFKGSVFMTFRDLDSCKKFVEAESMLYKGEPLIRKYQKDYLAEKEKEFEERRKKRGEKEKPKKEGAGQEVKQEEKEEECRLPLGTVLKLEGLGDAITREDIKEVLAAEFKVNIEKEGGDIAFITYEKGGADAKIRFKAENFAKPIAEQWNSKEKVMIMEREVKATLLEGEEEKKFLQDSVKDMKNMRNRNKNNKQHKRKNHERGGPQNKRARN